MYHEAPASREGQGAIVDSHYTVGMILLYRSGNTPIFTPILSHKSETTKTPLASRMSLKDLGCSM
jgi:hypothetical protein